MNNKNLPHLHKELDAIERLVRFSIDEFSVTAQLANTLVENAMKAIHREDFETGKEELNPQELMRWNEYTNKVTQILDKFGMDLQETLNQKLGQEVAQDLLEKLRASINSLKEKR